MLRVGVRLDRLLTGGLLCRVVLRRAGGTGGCGVRTFVGHPPLNVPLCTSADGQRPRWYVLADRRAGSRERSVANGDGRDERVVGAGLGVLADRGAVLVDAVVVGEDRAGADVGALADLGVADVRQVGHLGALA